jgi:hypothetical protein
MATATLPRINPAYDPVQNNMALPGAPVVADEDILKQQQPEKKEKKNKDKKDKKKDKKKKKDNKKKDKKKEDTVEKPIRQVQEIISCIMN